MEKSFETLEECLEYEKETYPLDDGLRHLYLWDENMRPIVSDGTLSYTEVYDKMHWFIIKKITDSSLDCIMRILADGCDSYPKEFIAGDVYTWSSRGWYNYSEKFRKTNDKLEIIRRSILEQIKSEVTEQ